MPDRCMNTSCLMMGLHFHALWHIVHEAGQKRRGAFQCIHENKQIPFRTSSVQPGSLLVC